jgi:HEAT repeat protein
VKDLLFELYQDKDSRVRDAVIGQLGQFKSQDVAAFLESVAINDSSYVVCSNVLRTMVTVDSARAFDLAARFVDTESYRDMIRRSCLGVFRSLRDKRALTYATRFASPAYETSTRTAALGVLREIGKENDEGRMMMEKFAADPNDAVRLAAIRALVHWDATEFRSLLETRQRIEEDKDVLNEIEKGLGTEQPSMETK